MPWEDLTELGNLIAWYKPESLSGYSASDPIDSWADSSGNGRTLSASGSARPLKLDAHAGGYGAADFNGSSNVMASAAFSIAATDDICLCMAIELDQIKDYQQFVAIDDTQVPVQPPFFFYSLGFSDGHVITGVGGAPGGLRYLPTDASRSNWTITAGQVLLYTTTMSAQLRVTRRDGQCAGASGAMAGSVSTNPGGTGYISLGFGGLNYLDGKILELALFDVTDDDEYVWVEGYLANRFGVTLDTGHVFRDAPPDSAPPTYNVGGGGVYNPFRQPRVR